MNRQCWSKLISQLPRRLSVRQAAQQFPGRKYSTVRYWLKRLRYAHRDGRSMRQIGATRACRVKWALVDWSQRDVDIARTHHVTRQAVNAMRQRLGK